MAKPFDATTKDLFRADPAALLAYLGVNLTGPVEVVDSDLSTVTAEADQVFRVGGAEPFLVHVEMQSSADATLPRRLLRYNALLDYRHRLRAWSVAILLRPEADSPGMTGSLTLRLPDGRAVHDFRFEVVRVWRQSAEAVLNGPLSLLPLAILADAPPEAARLVVQRISERLVREAPEPEAVRLMRSTYYLAGLRFPRPVANSFFSEARTMSLINAQILRDSSTFQYVEEQIRIQEARSILTDLAVDRFGPPSEAHRATLDAIEDHDRLVQLCKRVGSSANWDELLADPKQG